MRYLSGYVRHMGCWADCVQEYGEWSVLLQQISYGKCNVVLGCVCSGGAAGAYLTGGLKLWMADRGGELFGRKRDDVLIGRELEKEVKRLLDEASAVERGHGVDCVKTIEVSGILVAGQECWLLQGEGSEIYLLNRKYQRTHCRRIAAPGKQKLRVIGGSVERCVGVLVGNLDFLQSVSGEAICQCLAAQDIKKEGQIDSRLRELAEESRRRGYQRECSAIYVRSM